jgi:hypothetical protein
VRPQASPLAGPQLGRLARIRNSERWLQSLSVGDLVTTISGTAGELRYEISGGDTYVYGDSDGDGSADFVIMLAGSHAMAGADIGL